MPPVTPLDIAIRYIESGLRCVPITAPDHPNEKKAGKAPIIKGWQKRALTADAFRRLYRGGMNLGVVTGKSSGIICVDIDPRNGGERWFREHEDMLGNHVQEETGSGGTHIYYRYPDGVEFVQSWTGDGPLFPGVEVLADGGHQVVTWPSIHPTGVMYEIDNSLTLEDVQHEADPPPPWLMDLIFQEKPKASFAKGPAIAPELQDNPVDIARARDSLLTYPLAIVRQGGDRRTYKAACLCRDYGLTPETALKALWEVYNPRLQDKWTREGLWEKVDHAYGYARGEVGNKSIGSLFADPIVEPTPLTPEQQEVQERAVIGEVKFALKKPVLCAELLLAAYENRLKSAKDVVYHYPEADRVWKVITDTEFRSLIMGDIRDRDHKAYTGLTPTKVKQVADTLRLILEGQRFTPMENTWLTGDDAGKVGNFIRMKNGILDIERRELLPHSPDWFSTTMLPYDYDPAAQATEFDGFLDSIWRGDKDIKDCLRLWLGYLLLSDVTEQKFALLIGASRAGKGVISRVMERMIGKDGTVGCTLSAMANDHGLSMLVGKRLVVFGDVVKAPGNVGEIATERLISIIGLDPQVINRKFLDAYSAVLPVKIVMACNEFPLFMNNRQALTNRMLVFPFSESFAGREDPKLDARLAGEVSGVLNWAMEGAARILAGERLRVPAKAEETISDIKRKMDSALAFIMDCCTVHEFDPWDDEARNRAVETTRAYEAYKDWCRQHGHQHKNWENFQASVISTGNGAVAKERIRRAGQQITVFTNLEMLVNPSNDFN